MGTELAEALVQHSHGTKEGSESRGVQTAPQEPGPGCTVVFPCLGFLPPSFLRSKDASLSTATIPAKGLALLCKYSQFWANTELSVLLIDAFAQKVL